MKSEQVTSISAEDELEKDASNLEQARDALARLQEAIEADKLEACTTFLVGPTGTAKKERWRRVQFSQTLTERYRSASLRSLKDGLPQQESLVLFTYDENIASHTPVLVKDDLPDLADWLDEVPTADWNHTYDGDQDFLSAVKLHVASFSSLDGEIHLTTYKRRSASQLIKRQGVLASFTGSKNEFDTVKKPVFDFPVDSDFFEWEGFLFVSNISSLESTTNIREITNNQAKKVLQAIKSIEGMSILGLEEVEQRLVDRPRLAKRLANAARNRTLGALKASAVEKHIKAYALPLKSVMKKGNLQISFDTENRVHVEEFVNLVSDVYLKSLLTDFDYKSHSKQRVKKASS